ncbi:3-ketoacyl-ACP reductase [candidate division KSB1 bacterium]|nr:3-ketoacyl-ACP reductase [candidate division KSB1 bacterium]
MSMQKVALVTGAGRGIGRGIAEQLAANGWKIAINYRSNASAAEETRQSIVKMETECLAIQADISKTEDRKKLVSETITNFGQINLLINNAGVAPKQRVDILETSEESYDDVLGVNLKGPFFLTQQVAGRMVEMVKQDRIQSPKIINISSLSSYASSPNRAEYCLSKAGLSMMTKLFADRLAEHGICVYEVRPGIIETDMTSKVKDKYDQLIGSGLTPIRRWGTPDDVARAVLAIAEGAFPFSTGEVINVDGGFHLHRL